MSCKFALSMAWIERTIRGLHLEKGEVKETEMGEHPDQGRLLRALGSDEELRPTYGSAELAENDAFLLCSDGFWERTRPGEIEKLFQAEPTQARLEGVVHRAIERNGPKGDNVTSLAVFSEHSEGCPVPCFLRWPLLVVLLLATVYLLWQVWLSADDPLFSDRDQSTVEKRVPAIPE